MRRISLLEREVVDAQCAAVYDHYQRTRGHVPRMFRTVAHRPAILATAVAHLRAILETGTVPLRLKQLLIVRTSQLNRCDY